MLNIINLDINKLIPYINNPRNNENAIDKVASSIREFGFKVPIVIDKDNVVINGHTRLLASKKLGLKEVPCIVADDLTEAQAKAFRIADNKVAEYSQWNEDLLKIEIDALKELNFNVLDTGFEEFEIDALELKFKEFEDLEDAEADLLNNYEEPDKKELCCPNCGHVDSSERFKKKQ